MIELFLEKYKEMLQIVLDEENANRSATKVDILHGQIARNLETTLGNEYTVETKETTGAETKIQGRYINKKVDIVIRNAITGKVVAGIGVKVPMNSYLRNRNNYFENMLGETANIRSNNIPYFQIIILPDKMPNWEKNPKKLKDYYNFDDSNKIKLYQILSTDNSLAFYHTPVKTLLMIVNENIPNLPVGTLKTNYLSTVKQFIINSNHRIELTNLNVDFDTNVIYNDYEKFIHKVSYIVKGFD